MAKIGDWRNDHALEIPLDGVGGVSLLVRADLHRKGTFHTEDCYHHAIHALSVAYRSPRHRLPS